MRSPDHESVIGHSGSHDLSLKIELSANQMTGHITRALFDQTKSVPAHSPAQPPDMVGTFGVVGRGSGWLRMIEKCLDLEEIFTQRFAIGSDGQ